MKPQTGHNDRMGEGVPYDLVPGIAAKAPGLRGAVVVRPDDDAVIDALLADLFIHAGNCVRVFGDFQFAVSGDPALEHVLRRLLFDLNYREFPWARTRLWMTREWRVPIDDARREWPVVRDLIVEQSGIPPEQSHSIEVEAPDAPARYSAALREHLGWRAKGHDRLDFVLYAMAQNGDMGVIRWPCEDRTDTLCVERPGEGGGPGLVGLSAPFVNASRVVAVYAAGSARRGPLEQLAANLRRPRQDREPLPALALAPTGGELRWYLDREACGDTGANG